MAISNLPEIELDLLGPDGNVFAVLGYVKDALTRRDEAEGTKKFAEISAYMEAGKGNGEYAQLLAHIHDHYVRIIDLSGEYDFDDPLFDPTSD
ncbi:MAG: hypothetical protein ACYTGV_16045 [Planctomycetota bacterium]|jgi:hypothetical protein